MKAFTWEQLITGFAKKRDKNYSSKGCEIYDIDELYDVKTFEALEDTKAIIEYMDTAEEESALIAMNSRKKRQTIYPFRNSSITDLRCDG